MRGQEHTNDQRLEAFVRARLDAAAADGPRRIEEWERRGYVCHSDVSTRSFHLTPIETNRGGAA